MKTDQTPLARPEVKRELGQSLPFQAKPLGRKKFRVHGARKRRVRKREHDIVLIDEGIQGKPGFRSLNSTLFIHFSH